MTSLDTIKEKVRNYENKHPLSRQELQDYDYSVRLLKEQNAYNILSEDQRDRLKDIAITEDTVLFLGTKYRKVYNVIKRSGLTKLVEIFDYDRFQFLALPTAGVSKWFEFVQLRYEICERFEYYMEYCDYCIKETIYPILDPDKEYTLTEKVTLAYTQFSEHIQKIAQLKQNKVLRDFERLDKILFQELDTELLMDQFSIESRERIRQVKVANKKQLRRGYFDWAPNVHISQVLLAELFNIENSRPLYKSEDYLNKVFQCDSFSDTILPAFLRLHLVEPGVSYRSYIDQNYWVPQEELTSTFNTYFKVVYSALTDKNADVRPVSLEQIMEAIEQLPLKNNDVISEDIVYDILQHHKWIEQIQENEDVKFQMNYEHLSVYQKIARIIFVHKHVSAQEIAEIDKRWSGKNSTSIDVIKNWNTTRNHFSWVSTGSQNGYYEYNEKGTSKLMLHEVIEQYTKDHVIFQFEDLMNYLIATGRFSNLNPSSVRTYAMRTCQCANEDRSLLCLSEKIGEHSEYTWRSKSQKGIINWVISHIISYLKDAKGCQLKRSKLNDLLKKDVAKSEEKYTLRSYTYYIGTFVGENNIFDYSEDEKSIFLTAKGRSLTEKEISRIGANTRTPEFYKEVISTIQAQLRESYTGEMLLKDLKAACAEFLEGKSDTRFYTIVDRFLPNQIVKITRDNNTYLKLIAEKIEYETSMVIDSSEEQTTDIETPTLKPETKDVRRITPAIGQRIVYNWNELFRDMATQLSYYKYWWNADITMDEAFIKFKDFIEGVDNRRLSVNIPQCIYEFWHFKNDEFDYYRFLSELTLCYEQLLIEIHTRNTGVRLYGHGLKSIIYQIPEILSWTSNSVYRSDGFNKNYRSLYDLRNKLAHGVDITDTFVMMIQRISSFIALYIYTVAKFLH